LSEKALEAIGDAVMAEKLTETSANSTANRTSSTTKNANSITEPSTMKGN